MAKTNDPIALNKQIAELRGALALSQEENRAWRGKAVSLQSIFDSIPQQIYIKDRDSRFVFCSPATYRLWDRTPEEVLGKTDMDLMPDKRKSALYRLEEEKLMETGEPQTERDIRYCAKDTGEISWYMNRKVPWIDEDGAIQGTIGVYYDITERKLAEEALQQAHDALEVTIANRTAELAAINEELRIEIEERKKIELALRESEERFRTVIQSAQDCVSIKNNALQYTYVNPSFCKVYQVKLTDVIGLTRREVFGEDEAYLNEMATNGDVFESDVMRLINGEEHFFHIINTPLHDAEGEIIGSCGIAREITERKKAEEALRAASRMEATSTLAGGIAHDFNNLMVGVLGNSELLRLEVFNRPNAVVMLDKISKAAQKAGELAQQMLAFAHGGKYQPSIINFNETIKEMLHLQEASFPSSVHVDCDMESDLWNIHADPAQMNQVVINFCLNAVEAIRGYGRIQISTRNLEIAPENAPRFPELKIGRYVCLTVTDTGCGMTPETKSRVFEPFFTTKSTGRGLGLAAVYGILKNHDGHITVQSQLGKGSTFTIYIPATEAQIPASVQALPEIPTGDETVLIIDDEEIVQSVTQQILEYLGYSVMIAQNGKEALDILNKQDKRIDLALLDMGMPVMAGAEAFPLMLKIDPRLKVIICSGYELDAASQKLLDKGARAFVQKPFRMAVLGNEIRRVLDHN